MDKIKVIEELKRNIPKINVFAKDSSIIASDYYNWKDVYLAIDKAVEQGKAQAIKEVLEIIENQNILRRKDYSLWINLIDLKQALTNQSPLKLEETQAPKTLPQVEVNASGNLGDVSGSDTILNKKEAEEK